MRYKKLQSKAIARPGITRRQALTYLLAGAGAAAAAKLSAGCGPDKAGGEVLDASVDPVGPENVINYDNIASSNLYFTVVRKTETGNGGSLESPIVGSHTINNSYKVSTDTASFVEEFNEPTYFENDSGVADIDGENTMRSRYFDAFQNAATEYFGLDVNDPTTEGVANEHLNNLINGLWNNQEGVRFDREGTVYHGRLGNQTTGIPYVALPLVDQDNNKMLAIAYAGAATQGTTTPLSDSRMGNLVDLVVRMETDVGF